jgi:hypothetical protein
MTKSETNLLLIAAALGAAYYFFMKTPAVATPATPVNPTMGGPDFGTVPGWN